MPRSTFANLPEAKRQAIIEIALAEFAEHPYGLASLSRIVARAGIAKGSIYQYFADKQDFFLYLVDYAAQRQLALLSELRPPEAPAGFFGLLRWQMSASTQVAAAAPQLARLIARAYSDELPFHAEVTARLGRASADHLRVLLAAGVATGELASTLDPELAATMIRSLTTDIGRLIAARLGLRDAEVSADPTLLQGPAAEQIYDQVIAILRDGMGR